MVYIHMSPVMFSYNQSTQPVGWRIWRVAKVTRPIDQPPRVVHVVVHAIGNIVNIVNIVNSRAATLFGKVHCRRSIKTPYSPWRSV